MGNETEHPRRRGAWACVVVAVVCSSGCSGSGPAPECSFFSDTCNPTLSGGGINLAAASLRPQRKSLQVGSPLVLTVETAGVDAPSFQWQRSADGGTTYTDIPGATGTTFTIAAVNLSDDGARFRVDVRSNGVSVLHPTGGRLAVSAAPGVVFLDGEFAPDNWTATVIAEPTVDGPEAQVDRPDTGGNPGAFRRMTDRMPAGASSLQVLHVTQSAVYEPSALGAVYVIDFAEDCSVSQSDPSTSWVNSGLLIEQAGRRYVAPTTACANTNAWHTLPESSSIGPADLRQVDGPACGAGDACPDFSVSAAPLHFGYARSLSVPAGKPGGTIAHGIDNWKVTVWRR
jgi:hypothetical protein